MFSSYCILNCFYYISFKLLIFTLFFLLYSSVYLNSCLGFINIIIHVY
uniref:Uncharacterized protein n=1 Tax=Periphykon beckeri TaxID=2006982 RepID=A0A1Z1M2Q2_9FLOR|nr:hypothetical protein [Periphykon beckeri]ARW60338.1 hypothetical protein [Periphykon beckeri]